MEMNLNGALGLEGLYINRDEPVRSDPVRYKKKIRYKKPIRSGTKKIRSKKNDPVRSIFEDFCVFLISPGALGPLPSDRAHREDSDGMKIVFWDALGPEL